jgi:hypothetical protein
MSRQEQGTDKDLHLKNDDTGSGCGDGVPLQLAAVQYSGGLEPRCDAIHY